MNKDSRYDNYTQLLAKVDAMFEAVRARHADKFQCASGCVGCCQPGLSVFNVEARKIGEWIDEHPDVVAKIQDKTLMLDDPDYCHLLDRKGRCTIYEVRPMICRSHGMPISWGGDEENPEERDVCPLNFEGEDLNNLPKSDILSIDKLNILLSLINRQFDPDLAEKRVLLREVIQ